MSALQVDVPGVAGVDLHQVTGENPIFQAEFLPVPRTSETEQQPIHGVQGDAIFRAQTTRSGLVLNPLKDRLRGLVLRLI